MVTFNETTFEKIPFVKLEFDNSLVGAPTEQPYRVLILGTIASGSTLKDQPLRVISSADALTKYGTSELADTCAYYLARNKSIPLFAFDFPAAATAEQVKVRLQELRKYGQFNLIVSQWSDASTLKVLADFYDEQGRADTGQDGVVIAGILDTYANLINFTTANKISYKYLCIIASPIVIQGRDEQDVEVGLPGQFLAAALAASIATEAQKDPARPFNGLKISIPPYDPARGFSREELNSLVATGLSVYSLSFTEEPLIETLVTTWTKDAQGLPDESFSNLNTMLISSYLRYSFVSFFQKKYVSRRYKLAEDSVLVPPGAPILQPKTAKAEAINLFTEWEERGLVENSKVFTESLRVEKRDKYLLFSFSTDYIDQLIGIAGKLSLVR